MRIASVEIHNFRCLQHVELAFDDVTTFLGPNGAGKSSILRALDWFFNGEKNSLNEADIFSGAPDDDQQIQVRVTFDRLTETDRSTLGDKYAPAGVEIFTAWRTWDSGQEKITGKALAFPPFEAVRKAEGQKPKKEALEAARAEHPDLDLPKWSTIAGVATAMDEWERQHPQHLEPSIVSGTHFFGFHGQGILSGLFDYVLVTADLRASEESIDGRNTIIGRILERAVDRSAANEAFAELAVELSTKQQAIHEEHLAGQLSELAIALSAEVSTFSSGRAVQLRAATADVKPSPAKIAVSILDELVETSVDRQGHGFQRALLISALKMLATRGAKGSDGSVICLAVEEPELYQHPTQARVFARVLRRLTEEEGSGLQVAYATHSPHFVDPRYFDQVRRVTRSKSDGAQHPSVTISHASMESVCQRLTGVVGDSTIKARWDQVCLKNLSEALFADAVVLVEGDDDKAVLEGVAARSRDFAADGIAVAAVHGKGHLHIPHAILSELAIPTLCVFDNDSGCRARMEGDGKKEANIVAEEKRTIDLNRELLQNIGHVPVEDYPVGVVSPNLVAVPDALESVMEQDWPEWGRERDRLVLAGRGVNGKNAATYALAAEECPTDPSGVLMSIVEAARALV